MRWFKRKPREFDHAAIRTGNVYVLPPTEEDVRAFRRKRRKEVTRRGFLIGGIAVALGALSIPFWPRGGEEDGGGGIGIEVLTGFKPAEADPRSLENLRLACLAFYRHPDPGIRRLCADFMGLFERDATVCAKLWEIIDGDPLASIRSTALRSLLRSARSEDVARLVRLHRAAPWARQVVDQYADAFAFVELRRALAGQ